MLYSPQDLLFALQFFPMDDVQVKPLKRRVVRRRAPEAMDESLSATPEQMSAACGHSACGDTCNVHYVGPTSQVVDHHVYRAAHSASHVWAAAIISGLAVVLTGAIAYSSVEAAPTSTSNGVAITQTDVDRLIERLNTVEVELRDVRTSCAAGGQNQLPTTPPSINR